MLKTLTFAALHFSTAFSVTYVLTGSIGVSGAVALVEPLINTVVFYSGLTKTSTSLPRLVLIFVNPLYFHEKAWNLYEKNKTVQQTQSFQLHRCS